MKRSSHENLLCHVNLHFDLLIFIVNHIECFVITCCTISSVEILYITCIPYLVDKFHYYFINLVCNSANETLVFILGKIGATYLVWFGPTPRLTIAEPNLIREIFSTSSESYEKYESHPLVRKLEGNGLISLKGDLWAHRRKTISPIFHLENLKVSHFFCVYNIIWHAHPPIGIQNQTKFTSNT